MNTKSRAGSILGIKRATSTEAKGRLLKDSGISNGKKPDMTMLMDATRKDLIKDKVKGVQLEIVRKQSLISLGMGFQTLEKRKSVTRRVLKNEAVTQLSGHLVAQEAKRE